MYKQLMKKTIFSLLLLAVCSLGASAQSADDLDAKYTQGLLKVGTQAPDFVLKKAKADQPALSLSPCDSRDTRLPRSRALPNSQDATMCLPDGCCKKTKKEQAGRLWLS